LSIRVDPAILALDRVGDLERRIAQRSGEGVAQPSREERPFELDDEVPDRTLRKPRGKQPPGKDDRYEQLEDAVQLP
jgi:hypothetical protein